MADFQTVAQTLDLGPGEMKSVVLDGEEVVVVNVDGEYFSFGNTCPHAGSPLVDGKLSSDIVICPWHSTPFNVKTGKAQPGGITDDPVPTYEIRLEGNDIQIRTS